MDQRRKGSKNSPFRKGTRSNDDNNYNTKGSSNKIKVKGIKNSSGGWDNTSK